MALHVSRISDSSAFGLPSGHASFLTNAVQLGCDESFPSFASNRPASACVFGRKVTEGAEVVVKDRDETKFPLPVFYPKKITREKKQQPARPTHKSIQSTTKKPRPNLSKPRAKTPASAPTQSLKRLNPKKASQPAPFKRPTIPKLPPHPRPASTLSSKSADKISATEMLRYLDDVPKILEPEAAENPVQPLVDEIIKESLRKQREERELRKREESAAVEERLRRREEIAENNRRIREVNRERFKARKAERELPWGADQRRILGIAEQQFQKEAQVLREKRRTERAKSAGRSRLGLEILEILNPRSSPPKRSTSAEETSNSRNISHYDVEEIQIYMRRQKEMIREEQETEALRAQAEEEKRLSQLEDLEELQKYRLAHYKRSKRRKDTKRKSKKKTQKHVKIPSHSDSVAPEDSEVSNIMYQPHESSSLLMDREGRSCSLFGNIAVSEDVGNSTKLVASIVDKHGIGEKLELPKALNTAPVKEALDSSRNGSKPSGDLREDYDSSRSFEYQDQGSDPGLAGEDPEDSLFRGESDDRSHEDLLRRKEDVRRHLAELRKRMEDNVKDPGYDESSARDSDRPLPKPRERPSAPVVQQQEWRKMLQRDAAVKIQAHIRRFLAQRRVMRMLDELEEFTEEEEEVPVLLNPRKHLEPGKSRPSPIHVPAYEEDPVPLSPQSLQSSKLLSEADFQARLQQEQLSFARSKEQEIQQLRQENQKLLEDQKKPPGKPEEGYLQLLNSAKEQEMQQFQELMQTKCGSRVDLIEEMSMAFENMLDARYRHLAFMFSQNREGMQAALGSAPSEMDISSTFAHTNLQKEGEEAKTPELPVDTGLDSFLNKVLGTQESREIEKMAQEKFAEIAKKAEEQADSEEPSFDPYSARPENPFPDEDSESSSSLHSYDDRLQSPNMSEIKKEEEKGSPMKKKRVTDAFTKPLQLQLVTGEAQDSSSRSLSRSGKFRYFREEGEGKELPHVPSPDPASILRPNPMEAPFRIQQSEARDTDEPSKPQLISQVSKHFLEDIDSSGSFQDDVDEYSSVEDGNSQRVGKQTVEEAKIPTVERKKWEERDKNAVFEAFYRPFFDRAVAESLRLSGVRIVPLTVIQPSAPLSSPEEAKVPSQASDMSPVPAKPSKPSPPPTEITEIHLFDPPEKPLSQPSQADKTAALVDAITHDLLRKLLLESVPRPEEKAMPPLPPLNFQHLEEGKAKELAQKSKADAPEKANPRAIQDYLRAVFLKAANADFVRSISTPISFDPVDILGELQDIEQGPLITYDIQSKAIMPTEVFLALDEGGEAGSSRREMTPSTKDIIRDSKRFHNRLVFDAANESLQKFRPYGLKGAPLPWSTNVRALAPPLPKLTMIQDRVIAEVVDWSTFEVGKIPEGDIIMSSGQVDEEQLQLIREERLSKMLTQEILENDQVWVDYEAEEAQVKIDIADMILEQIMSEIEDFLHGLDIQS